MIAQAVVSRYASALADVVLAASSGLKPAEAVEQVRSISETIEASPELRAVLATPAISAQRKRAVIRTIAEKAGAAPVIRNFLLVLSDHRRIAGLPEMLDAFEMALDHRLGLVRAEVRSAFPLSDEQRNQLVRDLSAMTGAEVRVRVDVDPRLIGGVAVQLGSKVFDGSVRGQLAGLRERLAATL